MDYLPQLYEWLAQQKPRLETVLDKSLREFYLRHQNDSNFFFDMTSSNREAWNLSKGKDLCYDRYTVGFTYVLWYQARRINTFLRYFTEALVKSVHKEKQIEIYDLGAGAGAVQCAIGLVYCGLRNLGIEPPKIRIINIDTSPFMVNFNWQFLWTQFGQYFPEASEIYYDFQLVSWNELKEETNTVPWIVSSYLFDQTENRKRLKKNFKALVDQFEPNKIFLLSSSQSSQVAFQQEILKEILDTGQYKQFVVDQERNMLYKGPVEKLKPIRSFPFKNVDWSFQNNAYWNEKNMYASILEATSPKLLMSNKGTWKKIDLFNPPNMQRRDIELNKKQEEAAENDGKPTIITGTAGSGKTVVLTERIKNVCEDNKYDPSLRILFTTFNKELVKYAANWLEQILDPELVKRVDNRFYFRDSAHWSIICLNFDQLPPQFGEINGPIEVEESFHRGIFDRHIIPDNRNIPSVQRGSYQELLDSNFFLDEYHRVIYALDLESKQEMDKVTYLECERRGRYETKKFKKNSPEREMIWNGINRYLNILSENKIDSILTRRHKFLRKLRVGMINTKFTHIFVDEFQDCTPADIEIFYHLLLDPDQLVITGDIAQAVHLGKSDSVNIPRLDGMKRRNKISLQGSYRLPFRVSEAVKGLSEKINVMMDGEPDLLTPYRGAPPGARPIFVYAKDTNQMANKILQIVNKYKTYYLPYKPVDMSRYNITILEKDIDLYKEINQVVETRVANTDTILRLKGMEKYCIIWSTRAEIEDIDDVYHYVFTILTRSSSVLILALFDDMPSYCRTILSLFDKDQIIVWDIETDRFMNDYL